MYAIQAITDTTFTTLVDGTTNITEMVPSLEILAQAVIYGNFTTASISASAGLICAYYKLSE